MSDDDCRGSVYAFKQFMLMAQRDIETGGEIKPARRLEDLTVSMSKSPFPAQPVHRTGMPS